MSEQPEAPNIIIAPENQSAPKEHWVVEEMRKAAAEIDSGQFKPELPADEPFYYGPTQLVAMHPRVQAAIDKLQQEVKDARNSQELLEKAQMLHELNEQAVAEQKWPGQKRWQGAENEEMRMGELLDPHEFMRRLTAVIGEGRVTLNRFAVMGRVALLITDPEGETKKFSLPQIDLNVAQAALCEARVSHENFKQKMQQLEAAFSQRESAEYITPDYLKDKVQVATLQWPLGTEWMIVKFDEYGIPVCPKYLGWRTALLSMITLHVITEDEAHKAFPVKANEASLWYRAQLYQLRNGGKADA